MPETPSPNEPDETEHAAEDAAGPPPRSRRARRIGLISVVSVLLVFGAAIAGTYATVDHLTGNIRRIPNVFTRLDQGARPVMPAASRGGMTVLLTGQSLLPRSRSSSVREPSSGLIMLLRLDAARDTGAIVSIPGNAIVRVPGHPSMQLQNTARVGGPALLIGTVEHLTNVRIDHYTVIDYPHEYGIVNALGGVDVDLPGPASSEGIGFHRGINHLDGRAALAYVRQPSIPGMEGRELRQQVLLRAELHKISTLHLLADPLAAFQVLNAVTRALSVDSNLTNAELRSLVVQLGSLGRNHGTFVTAPVHGAGTQQGQPVVSLDTAVSAHLWNAIRNDSVAEFAKRYPATVTPLAPP